MPNLEMEGPIATAGFDLKREKIAPQGQAMSRLQDEEDLIIGWALHQCNAGFPLTCRCLVLKGSELCQEFRELEFCTQCQMIHRLCHANCLVIGRITHTAQVHPQETVDEALQWMTIMRPIVSGPNVEQCWVLNMDQMPLWLSMHPQHTLDLQGSTTVDGRCTCDSGTRHTCTITVASNGDKLKPFCVFKGRPNGQIAQREFPNNPHCDQVELVCQEAAWQDGANMLLWIDRAMVPHLQEKAQGAPALLLLLDQFSGHWTEEVATKLEEIGIASHKIPAGCTCLVQPIDVGIGKLFKDRVRSKWLDWMLDQGADAANLTHATRQQATQWVAESWADMSEEIVKASWRKSECSCFENEEGE